MHASWRTEWPLWTLLAVQFLLVAITLLDVPRRLDAGGHVPALLLLPLVALGLYIALLRAPRLDRRGDGDTAFTGGYAVLRFGILAVMTAMYGLAHLAMRGHTVTLERVVPLSIGSLFIIIGLQLRRFPAGWLVGVRRPWTTGAARPRRPTNRQAGWLMTGAGVAMMAAGALESSWLMVATVAGAVAGALWLAGRPHRLPPLPAEDVRGDEPKAV